MNENLRGYFHLFWLAGIVLCAIAAVFCTLFVSCTKAPPVSAEAKPVKEAEAVTETLAETDSEAVTESTPEPTPVPTAEPVPTELGPTDDMGEEYLSKFIFLGDSTTYGLAAYNALPWKQMWTTSLGTMDLSAQSYAVLDVYDDNGDVESLTIREAVEKYQPEYLIITLGLNGISYMDEVSFKEEYTDLVGAIQSISPGTKIICHSIYPVIDDQAPGGIDNEGINRANVWVYDVAAATGTRYLNTHDALMDETGNLRSEFCNGDGVHLDTPGCETVLNSIRTHGYK